MRTSSKRPVWLLTVLVVCALAAFGAGCGSGDDDGGSSATTAATAPSTGETTAAAIVIPDDVRAKGTLVVATDPTYAPNEFVDADGETIVGMDIDLIEAVGERLGLRVDVQKATFDGIIPGLAAGRFDVGISSFTDTRAREKTVDFVTYFRAGTSFYKRAGAEDVTSLEDLCGRTVAVEKGTTQARDVGIQSRRCEADGSEPVRLLVFPDQNGANLAIQSGRAEIGMADSPVAAYIVRQSGGQFEPTGEAYGTAPYGIALPKRSGLEKPILEAIRALIADGTYEQILEQWDVQDGAIDDPKINGAES